MELTIAARVAAGVAAIAAVGAWIATRGPDDGAWTAIRVDGRTIGRERAHADGDRTVRDVELSLPSGLQRSTQTVDHVGRLLPDGRPWAVGFDLDAIAAHLADDETRIVPLVDGSRVSAWRLHRAGDAVTAVSGSDRIDLTLRDGAVEREVRGPFERVRVAARPDVEPFDPTVFDVPTEPWPDVRHARHAVFSLDGAEVVVDTPLAAEVPRAELARIRGWLAAVGGTGDCQAQARAIVDRATADGYVARVAEGWVYRDEPVPAFVPHAWAVVRVGELEVPVDAALGEAVADASHVPAPAGDAWFAGRALSVVAR